VRIADVILFWYSEQLPEAKVQKMELRKHKYKGKCQEIQDLRTNEVFSSNETSVSPQPFFPRAACLFVFCARQTSWTA